MREAAKILDAAGYKLGKDGIRVHEKTGQRLSFEIIDANPAFERWTNPFIQNLKRLGVAATFRIIDEAQYENRMQNFDFDMTTTVIAQSDSPGNEQRDFWSSTKADIPGSRNYIGIKDPVVDELVELIINAPDRKELEARCHALDRVLLWNHYVIPHWYFGAWRLAWWKKLQHPEHLSGLTPGISDTWWVQPVKKEK
jgi:microcin C transport system substrate-binding protein